MEKPWTSTAAQYYAVSSLIVVGVSTLTFVLSTVEDATSSQTGEETHPALAVAIEMTGRRDFRVTVDQPPLSLDIVCVAIFTLEFTVRFLCSPVKKQFLIQPMNLSKCLQQRSEPPQNLSFVISRLHCAGSFLSDPGAGGAGGLPDHREGWQDSPVDESHEDPEGLQAVPSLRRTAVPHLHPPPGLQGARTAPAHHQ